MGVSRFAGVCAAAFAATSTETRGRCRCTSLPPTLASSLDEIENRRFFRGVGASPRSLCVRFRDCRACEFSVICHDGERECVLEPGRERCLDAERELRFEPEGGRRLELRRLELDVERVTRRSDDERE